MAEATLHFPNDFLWGTATAAYQVEGDNRNTDWWAWEQQPDAILHNHKSGNAANWWQAAEADIDLAAEIGTNAHRLSLSWNRIEPQSGRFDMQAIARYRRLLQHMHDRGIEPMVTLWHFVNPDWLAAIGDFNNPKIADIFERYSGFVAEQLGDLVPKWITLNEPLVYVFLRYLEAAFPPPKSGRGVRNGFEALRNLLYCHAVAYKTIKRQYPAALIGVAKQYRPFYAPRGGPLGAIVAGRLSRLFNDSWMQSMVDGKLRLPAGVGTVPALAGSFDFVGINYYTYSNISWPPRPGKLTDDRYPATAVVGDGNYGAVHPQGLTEAVRWALQFNKPIYITENGMPDDDDDDRPAFLLTHLRALWKEIGFNHPVMGYFHWSLVDNFEWERGWTQRFGLLALDNETQTRTWRNSARLYQEICRSNSISSDMTRRYAPDMLDVLFPGGS